MGLSVHQVPERLVTGAYVLHAGIEKWNSPEERASGIHSMAAAAYPQFQSMKAQQFVKMLSAGEIATGSLLLAPFVPARVAGAVLGGFAGGLLGLYFKTPGLRKEGSIWPSDRGIAISKDVWMLGIGLSLLLDGSGKAKSRNRKPRPS
jgi:uncharacterized membrane protein YphA (DoxX/SURF4 family)